MEAEDGTTWRTATREFQEETGGADWASLTRVLDCFTWTRIEGDQKDGGGGERWALFANASMKHASAALDLPSCARTTESSNQETCGVDWVSCLTLASPEKKV